MKKWTPPARVKLSDKTLFDFLQINAKKFGEEAFVFTEDKTFSLEESEKIIGNIIVQLGKLGIKKGDFIGLRATRAYDTTFIFIALQAIGAVAVLTDPRFEVDAFLTDCGTDIKTFCNITNEDAGGGISAGGNWRVKFEEDKKIEDLGIFCNDYDEVLVKKLIENIDICDPALIVFTSGSTGKSKAVLQTQSCYINNSVEGEPTQGHEEGDKAIALLPLYHIFGLAVIANAVITKHSLFFPKNIDVDYTLSCLEKYGITRMYAVPTYLLAMIADNKHKNYDLSKFRFALIAAGPSTPEQYCRLENELGVRIINVYGMSEYFGISRTTYDMPLEMRSAGVGTFNPNNEGFILDDNNNEVEQGLEGEICVRGYARMLKYYNNEEETAKVIDSEGRIHTGDLGFFDENGILHISGRKKDIIIRAGENISTQKIENAIVGLPCVFGAAVAGIKDELFGEVPAAIVELEKGINLSEKELLAMLATKLTKIELPTKIVFVDEIPKTSTGKTDKIAIKNLLNQ